MNKRHETSNTNQMPVSNYAAVLHQWVQYQKVLEKKKKQQLKQNRIEIFTLHSNIICLTVFKVTSIKCYIPLAQ